jgi:hypothetical protein
MESVQKEKINHIICFGKQAFQYISKYDESYFKITKYTKTVKADGFILSPLIIFKLNMTDINLYLTYPAAQGGITESDRIESLKAIKAEIIKRHKS